MTGGAQASSFDLREPHHFTTGTVGEPGRRVFYVQAAEGATVVTLKVEKAQVAALAQYMAELLADLPPVADDEAVADLDLVEPVDAEWTVGTIGVAFDESRDRMVVTFQELRPIDPDADPDEEPDLLDEAAALATFVVTRQQSMGFVRRAAELVSSGRPPCTLCGRPLDPEGHTCIKTNGHLPH